VKRWWFALLAAGGCMMAGAQGAPPQVSLRLNPGATLESVLAALNSRGHRIVYSNALVTPGMTLRAAPKATRLDALLQEILAPWRLRAVHAANGDWLIVTATAAPPVTTLREEAASETAELQTIDVTATSYALATPGSSAVFLDRRGVEQMPHLADDAVRMLKVLPGVSGGDFSAALNIRGGRREETLLRIDGAEIHGGFHFRDLDGALSVLDTNLVDSIDFITGGMTAQYADHMSGVVDLRTRRPQADDEYRSAAGISFVSAYGRTGGTFADGRGAWLASARRGYLDVVMERIQDEDEQFTPRYTDVFASLFYDLTDDSQLSAHVLVGEDDLKLISHDDDEIDSAGDGRAGHFWVTLQQSLGALDSKTVLATSSVRHTRAAQGEDEQRTGDVDADFRFRYLDLRSDWTWNLTERQLLLFGFNAGRAHADYEYRLTGTQVNPTVPGGIVNLNHAHDLDLEGRKQGAHAAWRGRVAGDLIVEAGARWDNYSYPGGGKYSVASPRFNAVYGMGDGELRAAWGVLHQPQGLHELQVEDDVTTFYRPERVHQAVLGYAHRFGPGLSARIDVYQKDYSRLRPRFENALDPVQLIPEGSLDRVRIDAPEACARGLELTLRREAERGFAGWASIAWAKTEEDVVGVGPVPRLWDQRLSLSMGLSWTGAKWNLNLAGLHHSGTPTTSLRHATLLPPGGPQVEVIAAGPRNGERLGNYARLDLRASRAVQLRSGRFSYYLEVTNLMNRENPCCKESYHLETGPGNAIRLRLEESHWLPMLPSFGFQFEF
jgi:hypothetical protein